METFPRFEVVKISWERVFLTLEIAVSNAADTEFYLERIDEMQLERQKDILTIPARQSISLMRFEVHGGQEGRRCFCCNISAFNGRNFLENGLWRIIAVTEGQPYICYADHALAYHFDEHSRIFHYGKNQYAYNVSFETYTIEEKELALLINSRFVKENRRWQKRRYVEEARTPKGKVKRAYMTLAIWLIRLFYAFWDHVFPKKGNRILLMSETHDYLWGNLKAIDEELKRQKLDQKYRIEYSFRKTAGEHQSISSWIRTIFVVARQDIIFVDDYVPVFGFLDLGKHTKLIQVWHAGEGFKAVGYCRFGKEGTPFPVGSCHKKYDYVLTGSQKLIKVFAEVFGIEEEAFLPVGMPRLDGFLDETRISEFREEFYQKYPNLKGKKLILFAPTYRGAGQKQAYYDYSWLDLKQIYDYCGQDKLFLFKMHPFVKGLPEIPPEYSDRLLDLSAYPNINDLYYVTDLLITDYSSNYYEYSLLKKPCLFYTPDREIYELAHGVHRSVKECAPGKVCDTFAEMMDALWKEDFESYKIEQFVKDNFGEYDGKAAKKAIAYILKEDMEDSDETDINR